MLVAETAVNEPFAVINADDYYGVDAFKTMAHFLMNECSPEHHSMVGYILSNTLSANGTVNRGVAATNEKGELDSVVERLKIGHRDAGVSYLDDNGQAHELSVDSVVSMNFWGFHPHIFRQTAAMFHDFVKATTDQPRAEFLIPEVVDALIQSGKAKVSVMTSNDKWHGVTYQEDKPKVIDTFKGLLEKEVYPNKLW